MFDCVLVLFLLSALKYMLTVSSFITINFFLKAQIVDAVTNETNNEPNTSWGKWTPQNTLETPPSKPRKDNIQPIILVDLKNNNVAAIDSIKVVWSDGNDDSGTCLIKGVPMFSINGRGWK